MSTERTVVDRLWPEVAAALDDAGILAAYAPEPGAPWLRMNFVTSLDGAATRDGRSGGLGDAADRRIFELLRRQADAVLIGAGTVRDEGYGAMRLSPEAAAWRTAAGLAPQPVLALVSRGLDLDPRSPVFADAPVRPIVYTGAGSSATRRDALGTVADVVVAGAEGDDGVDPARVRRHLETRGLLGVHAEGGPSIFGAFHAAGAVDELCLTIAPTVEAGRAPRIATSPEAAPAGMRLVGLLRAGDELFVRYRRA